MFGKSRKLILITIACGTVWVLTAVVFCWQYHKNIGCFQSHPINTLCFNLEIMKNSFQSLCLGIVLPHLMVFWTIVCCVMFLANSKCVSHFGKEDSLFLLHMLVTLASSSNPGFLGRIIWLSVPIEISLSFRVNSTSTKQRCLCLFTRKFGLNAVTVLTKTNCRTRP